MPLDNTNSSSEFLRDKVDTSNYYNLRYAKKNGKKNKSDSFLDSNDLVISIKRGKNIGSTNLPKK